MTDRELMQMALHTLEGWDNYGEWVWPESALEGCKRDTDETLKALRDRLTQPVHAIDISQERVDETKKYRHEDWCASLTQLLLSNPPQPAPCDCKPLKREWVGLTDEEILSFDPSEECWNLSEVARAIEAKLKEKNT